MRDIKRIKPFCLELAKIWEENAPDWRFGQFIVNVMGSMNKDPFFPEEDEMLEYFKDFFSTENEEKDLKNDEEIDII